MRERAEHVLALDLGTTSVRALVVSAKGGAPGSCAASASHALSGAGPRRAGSRADVASFPGGDARGAGGLGSRRRGSLRSRHRHPARHHAGLGCPHRSRPWRPPSAGRTGAQRRAPRSCWRRECRSTRSPSATKLEWWLRHEPAVQRAAEAGTLRLGTPDAWLTAASHRGRRLRHRREPGLLHGPLRSAPRRLVGAHARAAGAAAAAGCRSWSRPMRSPARRQPPCSARPSRWRRAPAISRRRPSRRAFSSAARRS